MLNEVQRSCIKSVLWKVKEGRVPFGLVIRAAFGTGWNLSQPLKDGWGTEKSGHSREGATPWADCL